MNYIVSIIGRPNVGKSTLFNRFIGEKKAIVHEKSGVTRDRIYGYAEWNGFLFSVVDTGGFSWKSNQFIEQKINDQIFLSIKESDVILFLVDIKVGLVNLDLEITNFIRKYNKIIFLVVNKVDNNNSRKYTCYYHTDFLYLGFVRCYYISALNGSGTGDLLDKLVEIFQKNKLLYEKGTKEVPKKTSYPKISIIGRPNVGKSTLFNSFLEREQNIVTKNSGTTRDCLDVIYHYRGNECILVDTPGMRKKSNIKENLEFYSTTRVLKTIKYTDVCLFMIDALIGWERQDMNIFKIIEKYHKCVIILINKWDSFYKKELFIKKKFEFLIRKKIYPFSNIPIIFISAKNKYGIGKIIPIALQIIKDKEKKLKTNILNKIMLPIFKKNPPTPVKNHKCKKLITIKYCTQLPSYSPKFIFFSNFPQNIKKSYKKFIENQIRYHFDFIGVPMQIYFRKK